MQGFGQQSVAGRGEIVRQEAFTDDDRLFLVKRSKNVVNVCKERATDEDADGKENVLTFQSFCHAVCYPPSTDADGKDEQEVGAVEEFQTPVEGEDL